MEKDFLKKVKRLKWGAKGTPIIIAVIISFLILIVLFFGVMAWGIYKLNWRGGIMDKFLEVMPLPAAKVDRNYILFPDYLKALSAAEKFYAKQQEKGFKNIPTHDELQKIVMEERLVQNILVKEISAKYNITVSQEEINDNANEVLNNAGGEEKFKTFLNDFYGISIQDYKKIFIEPNLYFDKTNEAIIDDESINGAAKKKIQEALSKLRNGEKFEDVVRAYSEDLQANENASQEFFMRGELPKDIEDQLFAIAEGKYTDVLTMTDSYTIFKLLKKDEDKGSLITQKIIVKIKTLSDLLKEQKEKAQIEIYAY